VNFPCRCATGRCPVRRVPACSEDCYAHHAEAVHEPSDCHESQLYVAAAGTSGCSSTGCPRLLNCKRKHLNVLLKEARTTDLHMRCTSSIDCYRRALLSHLHCTGLGRPETPRNLQSADGVLAVFMTCLHHLKLKHGSSSETGIFNVLMLRDCLDHHDSLCDHRARSASTCGLVVTDQIQSAARCYTSLVGHCC
jgi:hypothetical protein